MVRRLDFPAPVPHRFTASLAAIALGVAAVVGPTAAQVPPGGGAKDPKPQAADDNDIDGGDDGSEKAQDAEVESPEAARARAEQCFKDIITAYRSKDGVEVTAKVEIVASKDGVEGNGPAVEAKFRFGPDRRAQMNFRGYDIRIGDGKVVAMHDSNPLAYLEVGDNGSAYYQLFNAFQALPFIELGLALGEDDPGEVAMQLLPQIPNVVPVRLEQDEVEGQVYDVLVLVADDDSEELRLFFDNDTKLVESVRGVLRGGPMVEEGAELVFKATTVAARPKVAPTAESFRLDVAGRQKVDGLAALIDRRPGAQEAAEEDREVEGLKVGEPAPELVLPRVGEPGEWSLAGVRPKPVVVDFWATWCGPCVASIPELAKLAEEFKGRAEIVMVNTGEQGSRAEREDRIRSTLEKRKIGKDSPLFGVLDLDGLAARRWLVRAFPTTFLVAPDGKIAGVWVGSSPRSHRELRTKLEELCGKPADAAAPAEGAAEAKPQP